MGGCVGWWVGGWVVDGWLAGRWLDRWMGWLVGRWLGWWMGGLVGWLVVVVVVVVLVLAMAMVIVMVMGFGCQPAWVHGPLPPFPLLIGSQPTSDAPHCQVVGAALL